VNWQPWRYDHVAYQSAVAAHPHHSAVAAHPHQSAVAAHPHQSAVAAHPPGPLAGLGRLTGDPAATPWDPELAVAMRRHDLRVEEELTLDDLLQDLGP
jgi:hypothetical protein